MLVGHTIVPTNRPDLTIKSYTQKYETETSGATTLPSRPSFRGNFALLASSLLLNTGTIMANSPISDTPVDLGERNVGQPSPPALHAVLRPQRRSDGGGVRRGRGEHRRLEHVRENLQHLPESVPRGKGVRPAIERATSVQREQVQESKRKNELGS